MNKAFSLIELLIVVAIIAILAAIAVPNFLEAQVRAKVARTKADMRALATALESYRVDYDDYPWFPFRAQNRAIDGANNPFLGLTPPTLTTPLAYITILPRDPFEFGKNSYTKHADGKPMFFNPMNLYNYEHKEQYIDCISSDWMVQATDITWVLVGKGPDNNVMINEGGQLHGNAPEYFNNFASSWGVDALYDPSNGTLSRGDIICFGPGALFEPYKMFTLPE